MLPYEEGIIAMLQKAEELKNEGNCEEAIKLLQTIILEEPGCTEAYEELGDNYLSMRESLKAQKALLRAIELNSKSSNAHYLLGFLFSIKEDWKNSVEELKQADEIAPNHPEILRCLGWAVYNSNRRGQGISILERSRNLSPFDPNILCDLGVCYMNSIQYEKAEEVLKMALKIDPNSDQARECLKVLEALKSSMSPENGSTDNTTGLI